MAATTSDVSIRASFIDRASPAIARTQRQFQRFSRQAARAISGGVNRALGGIFRQLTSIQGLLATLGVGLGLREVINEALNTRAALAGLSSVAKAYNQDQEAVRQAAKVLVSDGLLSVQEASLGLKNLLSSGLSLEKATRLMKGLQEQAINNRQAHLGLGQAVVATTEGIRNENSVLSDATGTTRNLFKMFQDYANLLGKSVTDLTRAEKAQAAYNGFLKETAKSQGDLQKAMNSTEGGVLRFNASINLVKASLGELLLPALSSILKTLQPLIMHTKQWAEANRELIGVKIDRFIKELIPKVESLLKFLFQLGRFAIRHTDIIATIFVIATIVNVTVKLQALLGAVSTLTPALAGLGLVAGPLGWVALGFSAIALAIGAGVIRFGDMNEKLGEFIDLAKKTPKGPFIAPRSEQRAEFATTPSDATRVKGAFLRDKPDVLASILGDQKKIQNSSEKTANTLTASARKGDAAAKKQEAAATRVREALKRLGVTTAKDVNPALKDLDTLMQANALSGEQLRGVQEKVLDLWVKSGRSLAKLPSSLASYIEQKNRDRKASQALARDLKAVNDRRMLEGDLLDASTERARKRLASLIQQQEEQKRLAEELKNTNEAAKQETVKRIILFFDADVTRVKTQADLAIFSLGQLARALGNISGKANTLTQVAEAAIKGGATGGPIGAIAAAGSVIVNNVFGKIFGLFGGGDSKRRAQELAQAQQRLNEEYKRQKDLIARLSELQAGTTEEKIRNEQKTIEEIRKSFDRLREQVVKFVLIERSFQKRNQDTKRFIENETKLLEARNNLKQATIELLQAEQRLAQLERQRRADRLSLIDLQFQFAQTPLKDQIAVLMAQIPDFAAAEFDERRSLAQRLLDLNKQLLQKDIDAQIKAIEDAAALKIEHIRATSQQELDALNERFDLERSLLRSRLAASFNIESEALRLQFQPQFGAARGNSGAQTIVLRHFMQEAGRLQRAQQSRITVELARLQEMQEARRQAIETRRDNMIAAIEASKAERIEAFQQAMNLRLLTIAQLLSQQLQLGVLPGPGVLEPLPVPIELAAGNIPRVTIENINIRVDNGTPDEIAAAVRDPQVRDAILEVIRDATIAAGSVERLVSP